ncbi:MAG: hypothetical protein IPP73_12550 [Chitinophagaceae bacterium]|nr:hypothetical protein [Chitinophagaceae bacterium]
MSVSNGYYAIGSNNSSFCISAASNAVNVTSSPNPTITPAATATAVCFSNSTQNSSLSHSATTNSPTTYTITWNAAAHTAGLVDLSSTAITVTPLNIPVAANVAGGTYTGTVKVSNGCSSVGNSFTMTINTAPAPPTGSASQLFCDGATVANLSATGTSVLWYATASGGTALLTSDILTDGSHYYASQTVSGCQSSSRLDVTANVIATGSWTGSVSTNWFTAGNWCGGAIPISTSDVIIAAGLTNYPSIGSSGAVCKT